MLEQSKNEHLLYDHLRAHGAEVQWRTELVDFDQDNHGVTARVTKPNGTLTEVSGRYLVGCDGASSLVRHQLGLGFEGSTFPRLFFVADVEMTLDVPDTEINNDGSTLVAALGENAYLLMAPMKGDAADLSMTRRIRDCQRCGRAVGKPDRDLCARCHWAASHAPVKHPCRAVVLTGSCRQIPDAAWAARAPAGSAMRRCCSSTATCARTARADNAWTPAEPSVHAAETGGSYD